MMNEREMVDVVVDVLQNSELGELMVGRPNVPVSFRTFRETGLMTSNEGFVVRVHDEESGEVQEFQVTVVRSR